MKKQDKFKIIFVLLTAVSILTIYVYVINTNIESIAINEFYDNVNSIEGEGDFSKSELQSLQSPTKDYKTQSPDNFSIQIRALDNWSSQTSSSGEPIYFALQKSNYILRISKFNDLVAEKRNINLPTETADYIDYVF